MGAASVSTGVRSGAVVGVTGVPARASSRGFGAEPEWRCNVIEIG